MLAERAEHGVGDVAHARLQGQEALAHGAALEFGGEELGDVLADAARDLAGRIEGAGFVGEVGFDDAGDLGGIDLDEGLAGAVGGFVDRDRAAVRRIIRLVDVVHAEERRGMVVVELDEDLVRDVAERGRGADRGGEDDGAVVVTSAASRMAQANLPRKP